MIRFLHRGKRVALTHAPADMTVLEYLREDCALTGTKEGCASGDCGACTVVVASADQRGAGKTLRYTPLNACIAPLGSLHSKQLISVEDLSEGDSLHPVQQALVDCHASQCGFCTPGFVMSLFALYHDRDPASAEDILEALGGNLCRCTGYRPIIEAAEQALSNRIVDQFGLAERETVATLIELGERSDRDDAADKAEGIRYFLPSSASAVASLLAELPQAQLVAGGTDLLLEVTQQLKQISSLIDLRNASELHEINVSDTEIVLGAAVTHRDSQPSVLGDYPELAELIERFGALQIRSQGTVAGNIANASPIGDWPPVLLALGGSVRLQAQQGVRDVKLDDFFLDYRKTVRRSDEFIRSVHLPRRPRDLFLRAYKISKRYEDDISSLCMVVALAMQGDSVVSARIAFGGMAATPRRATQCEQSFVSLNLRDDQLHGCIAALDRDFQPISDARASAGYRSQVAANLLRRLQSEFSGGVNTRARPVPSPGHHDEARSLG